jgi:hypothetical protein
MADHRTFGPHDLYLAARRKRLPIAGRSLDGQQARRVRNSRFGDENAEDAAKVQLSTSSDLDRFQSGRRLVTRQASRWVGRVARPRRLNTLGIAVYWNETTRVLDAAAGRVKNVADA